MTPRTPLLRFLALLWAAVQMASPALGALAEARVSEASAARPVSHVESSPSASCPVVHPPDCAVCRYLSSTTPLRSEPARVTVVTQSVPAAVGERGCAGRLSAVLPDGRAPPRI